MSDQSPGFCTRSAILSVDNGVVGRRKKYKTALLLEIKCTNRMVFIRGQFFQKDTPSS